MIHSQTRQKKKIKNSLEFLIFVLAGSDNKSIYKVGPYSGNLAYRRSYIDTHKHDEKVTHGEESSFLNNYTQPMLQLDPSQVVLLISHSENTFDKRKIRDESPVFKLTDLKLDHFIQDPRLIDFYKDA